MEQLTSGMRLDDLPVNQPTGSWRWAKNITAFQRGTEISNEDGCDEVTPTALAGGPGSTNYPINKKNIGVIQLNNESIYFFATNSASDSEIGRIKANGQYYPIIKDALLNFNQNFPIAGTFIRLFNNNIIISWTDFSDPYKILNIDCVPFSVDGSFAVISGDIPKAKALLQLFPPYTTPIISQYFLEAKEGQGGLTAGTYYPIVAYELSDGSITPWSRIYNGIPIFSSNINNAGSTISGGQPGDATNKSIEITFTNIDTNYKRLRVGYLYIKGGITIPYYETSYTITASTQKAILTGNTSRVQITLSDVLNPNVIYSTGKGITTIQNKLHLANTKQSPQYNYQNYANLITVKWVREKKVEIITKVKSSITAGAMVADGTLQDPTKVYFDKSFKSGECYAFYIVFKLKDGTYTKAFHIPGRASSGSDKNVLVGSVYDALDNANPVYKYQIFNTNSTDTTPFRSGNMGFWENENEQYPVDPANPGSAVHPDYANIPGISFGSRKVRHHVFPDLTQFGVSGTSTLDRFVDGTPNLGTPVFPNTDVYSKSFGVQFTNVNIPSDLLAIVDSWEILYAKRDNPNIRIIGNDCPSNNSDSGALGGASTDLIFQMFDLMTTKASLIPTYLKPVWSYVNPTNNGGFPPGQEANFVDYVAGSDSIAAAIYAVTDFKYLGQATTVPINNAGRADNIYMTISPATGFGQFDIAYGPAPAGSPEELRLTDFCIYKRNMYLGFNTQSLVSTGYVFKITGSGVQSSQKIYGGDVYICRHSVIPTSTGNKYISYVCESVSNIGLRSEDITNSKYFAPKYANPTPSWFGYNKDYNCINDFNLVDTWFPSDTCNSNVTFFPRRIPFGVAQGNESKVLNWRIFKANDYYEMVSNKGAIWSILGSNRTLYIHMEFSLFLAEIKDTFGTGTSQVFLGTSQLFDRPPFEVLTTSEGFAGTQSQFACMLCRLGYCFIDRQQGKAFILPYGGTLREISSEGMFNFFLYNSQTSTDSIDNPAIGMGYTMAYDQRNNRIIICKQDTGGYDFTISYSAKLNQGQGGWESFHTYRPHILTYNRNGLFAIENLVFKVFKHNSTSVKGKFYNNTINESYIDIVSNDTPTLTKRFDNLTLITDTYTGTIIIKNKTATHLIVYNNTQCSGKIALAALTSWFKKDIYNAEDTWNFNNFNDLINDSTTDFLDNKGELITGNINSGKLWYQKSKFISKFVVFRVIYDNVDQNAIHISYVGSNLKKSDR